MSARIGADRREAVEIMEKPGHAEFAKISRENHSVSDEAVRKVFEWTAVGDAIAEHIADDRLCQLHEIGDADDAIARVREDVVARLVFEHMFGAAVVLVAVEFDDKLVPLAALVRSELARDVWNAGVGKRLGVKALAKESAASGQASGSRRSSSSICSLSDLSTLPPRAALTASIVSKTSCACRLATRFR